MNTATAILFLKRFILGEFVKSLFWMVAYKGVEKAVSKGIKKAEEKGWTRGVDVDENELSILMVQLVKGESIPPNKRAFLQKTIVQLIYKEKSEK